MKIGFDCGHTITGKGTGAVSIVKETDINRTVGKLIMKYLKELGATVIDCTVDKSDNDLRDRVRLSNDNKVDLFVSLHLNCGGGVGTETFVYKKGGAAEKVAKRVNEKIVKLGFKNRGIKEGNLHVVRETKAPAILIEIFFIDSNTDVELYKKIGDDKIAKEIAQAIMNKNIVEETKQQYFRVVCGSYTERKNAEIMQEKLQQEGFDSFLEVIYK